MVATPYVTCVSQVTLARYGWVLYVDKSGHMVCLANVRMYIYAYMCVLSVCAYVCIAVRENIRAMCMYVYVCVCVCTYKSYRFMCIYEYMNESEY